MPEDKHARLQALLLDRKSKTPKGRASAPFPIILDADLAIALARAEQSRSVALEAIAEAEKEAAGDKRMGGTPKIDPALIEELTAAEASLAEAEAAADEATVQIVFTALKTGPFDELVKEHPPREGDETDQQFEYNRSTFPDALVRACATKVVDLDGDEIETDPLELIDGFSNGERITAQNVVNGLNQQAASVPFYNARSQSRQRNGAK
jgi:hypothetical protein